VNDWIDFVFLASGSAIVLETSRGGRRTRSRISRMPGTDWGMTFAGQSPRSCRRRCVFCFVDQNPPGVRKALRVKDDDVRYSFYQGTFVTLGPGDVRLAVEKRLSPVHVSVHSTDPVLRGRLLGLPGPEPVLPQLMELSGAGIAVEAQVVVVPGWNDGRSLERTLADLQAVPSVASVGVVPVGLTSHRSGLPLLSRPSPAGAEGILEVCDRARAAAETAGRGSFVYPADELIVLAGRTIPEPGYYDGCGMKADGIGLLADLVHAPARTFLGEGELCSGTLAAPFLRGALEGSRYSVLPVFNGFFGPEVGVSGLLAGGDVVEAALASPSSLPLVLPSIMFNHDRVSVDGMTPEEIGGAAGRSVTVAGGLEELP